MSKRKKEKRLSEALKALVFVEHIEQHLREMFPEGAPVTVKCKVCGKTIDEIYAEAKAHAT